MSAPHPVTPSLDEGWEQTQVGISVPVVHAWSLLLGWDVEVGRTCKSGKQEGKCMARQSVNRSLLPQKPQPSIRPATLSQPFRRPL